MAEYLENKEFKVRLILLNSIIIKINQFNIKLQSHCLEIQKLKLFIHETINLMLSYILNDGVKVSTLEDWLEKYPKISDVPIESFKTPSQLVEFIIDKTSLPETLSDILSEDVTDSIGKELHNFIYSLINGLLIRLPLTDRIFNSLDFVHLRHDNVELQRKIKTFAENMHLLESKKDNDILPCIEDKHKIDTDANTFTKDLLHDELVKLSTYGNNYFLNKTSDCAYLWTLIEHEGFKILPALARKSSSHCNDLC